jgi:hypothetical protein
MQNLHRPTSCSLLSSWFQFAPPAYNWIVTATWTNCLELELSTPSSNSLRVLLPHYFCFYDELRTPNSELCHSLIQLRERHQPTVNIYHMTPTHCCCLTSSRMCSWRTCRKHMSRDGHPLLRTMSSILHQLPDTRKTQLALPVRARIVFTELLPGNALIKYITINMENNCYWSSQNPHLTYEILLHPVKLVSGVL